LLAPSRLDDVDDVRQLLREAIALIRERPCHRPECIAGDLDEPSHHVCQQIRDLVERAEAALAQ
jgi:hypothetical protein